jgi:hypothetical protein
MMPLNLVDNLQSVRVIEVSEQCRHALCFAKRICRKNLTGSMALSYTGKVAHSSELRKARKNFQ